MTGIPQKTHSRASSIPWPLFWRAHAGLLDPNRVVSNQLCSHTCLGEQGTGADGDQHLPDFTGHVNPLGLLAKMQALIKGFGRGPRF